MSAENSFDRINNKVMREMRPVDVFYSGGKFMARLADDSVGKISVERLLGRYDASKLEYSPQYLADDMEWAERAML